MTKHVHIRIEGEESINLTLPDEFELIIRHDTLGNEARISPLHPSTPTLGRNIFDKGDGNEDDHE